MRRTHVVGAGMAGLAAALALSRNDGGVTLYEAAGHGGGRCRSFHDETLGREIDNGNHLLLSGNTAADAYLTESGAQDTFLTLDQAAFPFVDLSSGERWSIRPNAGVVPWWIFAANRRVPASSAWDYMAALGLRRAGPRATVFEVLGGNTELFRQFWQPLAVAILNTPSEDAYARLLWPVLLETFGRGAAACHPKIPRKGLSRSLVEPTLSTLRGRNVEIKFGHRLRHVQCDADAITGLDFGVETLELNREDVVVLALPATAIPVLMPEVPVPDRFHSIVNIHFRYDPPAASQAMPFIGILGGTAEWAFMRDGIVSLTVSAADALAEVSAAEIAKRTWKDVSQALDYPAAPLPAYRVVKERRATFAQTPRAELLRPDCKTRYRNLFLAGDWTNTGLPATIEGAMRSGFKAASVATAARISL